MVTPRTSAVSLSESPAIPAPYRARLSLGDWNAEVPFEILADLRVSATPEDCREQLAFTLAVRDKLSEIHGEISRLRAP